MKNLTLFLLLLVSAVCFSQTAKPEFANLPTTDEVSITIKGLSLENRITQEQLIPIKQLDLVGDKASKYKVVYYHFKTNYERTVSKNDEFTTNQIPEAMTQFFTDLEKNCKLTFDDIVVQNTETGKQYKITSLNVLVKVEDPIK